MFMQQGNGRVAFVLVIHRVQALAHVDIGSVGVFLAQFDGIWHQLSG